MFSTHTNQNFGLIGLTRVWSVVTLQVALQRRCDYKNLGKQNPAQMLPESFPNQLCILGGELAELSTEEGAKDRGSHGQGVRCVTQSLVLIDIGAAIHLYIITERKRIGLLSKMSATPKHFHASN